MTTHSESIIGPVRNVRGSVSLPGDKSISHRYAMLAAHRRRPIRPGKLFYGRGLRQHTRLPAHAWREVDERQEGDNTIEVQGSGHALTAPKPRSIAATPARPYEC